MINFRSKSLPKWNSETSVVEDHMCSITKHVKMEWHVGVEVTREVGVPIGILNKSTRLLGSITLL